MAPLAASLVASERAQRLSMLFLAVLAAVNIGLLIRPSLAASMNYQDAVMREADRRTLPNERVWDGCGYALRREPAYRYWFLAAGVRMMAARGMTSPYDAPQMISAPPAAIIHSFRIHLWLRTFPRLMSYATRHYIPLYRDLWIPGLNAVVEPGGSAVWVAPRGGRYRLYASEVLTKHPWFGNPLTYAMYSGPDASLFTVSLRDLPAAGGSRPRISVDGAPVDGGTLVLRRGSVVRLRSSWSGRVGVILVPEDVSTLFIAPDAGARL
jgi:hypothetical protein